MKEPPTQSFPPPPQTLVKRAALARHEQTKYHDPLILSRQPDPVGPPQWHTGWQSRPPGDYTFFKHPEGPYETFKRTVLEQDLARGSTFAGRKEFDDPAIPLSLTGKMKHRERAEKITMNEWASRAMRNRRKTPEERTRELKLRFRSELDYRHARTEEPGVTREEALGRAKDEFRKFMFGLQGDLRAEFEHWRSSRPKQKYPDYSQLKVNPQLWKEDPRIYFDEYMKRIRKKAGRGR